MRNFNPRAPCGARLYSFDITADHVVGFQPTRPLRGATFIDRSRNNTQIISTHAPLAGRDERLPFSPLALTQISTHAPLAGRDGRITIALIHDLAFQPTRPLRGATNVSSPVIYSMSISTHAPLAGRDHASHRLQPVGLDFNPRAPCGARQNNPPNPKGHGGFQPTRPLRGATFLHFATTFRDIISTHAPLAGRDR